MNRLPTPEEWRILQGGEPTILQSPSGRLFEIIHTNGAIVPTPAEQLQRSLGGSALVHLALEGTPDDVVVPATLLWDLHGAPCEARSGGPQDGYERLELEHIPNYIANREAAGWHQRQLQLPQAAI